MYPYLVRLGSLSIPAYPVLYGLGITLGFAVLLLLAVREGIDVRKLVHLILVITFSCILGGRFFYVLHHTSEFTDNWEKSFRLSYGGQVLYGGLLVGILSVFIFCKLTKLPLKRIFDLMAIATPAGLALGRWACFCRGCCYGRVTDIWWAVKFPKHIDISGQVVGSPPFLRHLDQALINANASHSLSVHPSQIYSSLLSVTVFIIMFWFWKRGFVRGRLVFVYLILYAMSRFIVEFTRDNQMAFAGLTVAQVLSIVIGLGSACGLLLCHFRKSIFCS